MDTTRKQAIARASLIVLAAVLPFLPTLFAGFPWDEFRVSAGSSRFVIVAEHLYARPLASMLMSIEGALMGGWAPGYHVLSILLHTANAVLVYHIARRMFGAEAQAMLSAALFAAYPVHAETLSLVIGQAMLLGGLFGLLSFLMYLNYARSGVKETVAAGALFMFLGALAWQAVLVVPLLVMAHAIAERMERGALLRTILAYLAAVVVYVVYIISSGSTGEIFHGAGIGSGELWRALMVAGHFLSTLAAPVFMTFATPLPEGIGMLLPVVLALAVIGLLWAGGLRKEALLLMAVLVLILPAALSVSSEPFLRAWFRQLYLGSAGMALFAGAVIGRLTSRRWFWAASVPLLVVFAASAVNASLTWRSRDDIWKQAAIANPSSSMPMLNLSAGAISDGRHDAGRDYLARTLTFRPITHEDMLAAMRLYADIGGANNEMGLLNAISVKRGFPEAAFGMGMMHFNIHRESPRGGGDLDRSIEYFDAAAKEAPGMALYAFHLGMAYAEAGDITRAAGELQRVLTLHPDSKLRENTILLLGALRDAGKPLMNSPSGLLNGVSTPDDREKKGSR